MEALRGYLEERLPQIEDLKEAVLAADRGEFASDEEVGAVIARYSEAGASPAAPKSAAKRRAK